MARLDIRGWRLLMVLAILASSIGLFPAPAHACSCMQATLDDVAADIDVAFLGRQVLREELSFTADAGVRLVFEVERVYKGKVFEEIELFTHAQSSACGVDFGDGAHTTVLASEWRGKLQTSLCNQLVPASGPELEATFGAPTEPAVLPAPLDLEPVVMADPDRPPPPSTGLPWMWIVLIGALGVASAAAGATLISRRDDM